MNFLKTFLLGTLLLLPAYTHAQEAPFADIVFRAQVVQVEKEGERAVEATGVRDRYQELTVRIIEGERTGELVRLENTAPVQLSSGDIFYLHVTKTENGDDIWAVGEPDRRTALAALAVAFVLVTILVGGLAGVRALVSLAGSFALIIFGLVPLLYAGAPPILTCVLLAVLMLVLSMLVTHGINRPTFVALGGSVVALTLSAFIAEAVVASAKLSGFVSDETVYLNFATNGALSLEGLLLGGILVGIVGVLNDISVSQAHTVSEIVEANPALTRREVFMKAMRVGQHHLGAVVNTLPLAYAGASLPLLMLFSHTDAPLLFILNREIFSAEIIRILAGGLALSLSGAVATVLAVLLLVRHKRPITSS